MSNSEYNHLSHHQIDPSLIGVSITRDYIRDIITRATDINTYDENELNPVKYGFDDTPYMRAYLLRHLHGKDIIKYTRDVEVEGCYGCYMGLGGLEMDIITDIEVDEKYLPYDIVLDDKILYTMTNPKLTFETPFVVSALSFGKLKITADMKITGIIIFDKSLREKLNVC